MNYDVNKNGYWFSKEQLTNHDAKVREDAIDEIIEHYKPCNDCGACHEFDKDYFKKKCEMDMQIPYTELVEYL